MGFGLPSAVGAQIGCPEKSVVSISGDGGFQMNMQELATAVCQELPLVNIVFNNNRLGMVRQMQELFFKKRYTITCAIISPARVNVVHRAGYVQSMFLIS